MQKLSEAEKLEDEEDSVIANQIKGNAALVNTALGLELDMQVFIYCII